MPVALKTDTTREHEEFWAWVADGSGPAAQGRLAGGWAVLLSITCSAEEGICDVLGTAAALKGSSSPAAMSSGSGYQGLANLS